MRFSRRDLCAVKVASGARPDHADVRPRRDLALRGRRQRAVAAGARQRRSPDHAAAVARAALAPDLPVDIIQLTMRSFTGAGENWLDTAMILLSNPVTTTGWRAFRPS